MKVCLGCHYSFASWGWVCPRCGRQPESRAGFICFAPDPAGQAGFLPEYFVQLHDLESKNFWFRARNSLLQWALQRYFPQAHSLLEVGCGTGFVLAGLHQKFHDLRIAGTDIFTQGLGIAQTRLPGVEVFQMDARHMPFEAEFDVIGAFDVLEHIDEDEQVLAEFRRSCKPGGGIILTVPQHPFLWSAADEHAFHRRRYTRPELISKIQRAGFDPLYTTSFVSFLLPLMLASRARRKNLDARFDPLAEFRIHPILNRALEFVLTLERSFIRAGLSFRLGGSLLAIARRKS
jgi:SAM-dependent methyltransferase